MTPSGDMPNEQAQEQSCSLANIVPQTGPLNRGVWEGIEDAVRELAIREGELYLVTGAAFQGTAIQSIGPGGVLVPTATWKAVYDPQADGAGVYVCGNTAEPTCSTISVDELIAATGVDPFPVLPDGVKRVAMRLPPPDDSPYGATRHQLHRRQPRSLFDVLLHWMNLR